MDRIRVLIKIDVESSTFENGLRSWLISCRERTLMFQLWWGLEGKPSGIEWSSDGVEGMIERDVNHVDC